MPGDIFIHDSYLSLAGAQLPWLLVVWLGVLGAVIGSFLNVVVYRLPRRMGLSIPGSHCPHCQHAIRWYDNLPVVGWLKLRGKCRDCHAAISPRYPLVEALVAGVFVALALVDLDGILGAEPAISPVSWARFANHATLLTTLIAAALIKTDSQALPWRLFWPALAVALVVSVVWPKTFLFSAAWYPGDRFAYLEGPPLGWPECLAGLASGFVAGSVLTVLIRAARAEDVLANVWAELATLGACLGWQATMPAGLIVLCSIYPAARRIRITCGCLCLVAFAWILTEGRFRHESAAVEAYRGPGNTILARVPLKTH